VNIWLKWSSIDKSSSSELSEAINSMYKWYQNSRFCYVYLADVRTSTAEETLEMFLGSRWFTRGWTLQELLAPSHMLFFDQNWAHLLTLRPESGKYDSVNWLDMGWLSSTESKRICEAISKTTGIRDIYITGEQELLDACVAEKMSWSAKRQTTREEDKAYSLLGILNLNMPLMYGEGSRAFSRLQAAIAQETDDHTLFTWPYTTRLSRNTWLERSALATSPRDFLIDTPLVPVKGYDMNSMSWYPEVHYSNTNKGIHITLPFRELPYTSGFGVLIALKCTDMRDFLHGMPKLLVAIPMFRSHLGSLTLHRTGHSCKPTLMPRHLFEKTTVSGFYLRPTIENIGFNTWESYEDGIKPITLTSERSRLELFVDESYPPDVTWYHNHANIYVNLFSGTSRNNPLRPHIFGLKLAGRNPSITGDDSIFLVLSYTIDLSNFVRPSNLNWTVANLRIALLHGKGFASLLAFVLQEPADFEGRIKWSSKTDSILIEQELGPVIFRCTYALGSTGEVMLNLGCEDTPHSAITYV
jgi:hypothetical protein